MQIDFYDYVEYSTKDLEWIVQEKAEITAIVKANACSLVGVTVDGTEISLSISPEEQSRILKMARSQYERRMKISERQRE
jgi:hypothetical protein